LLGNSAQQRRYFHFRTDVLWPVSDTQFMDKIHWILCWPSLYNLAKFCTDNAVSRISSIVVSSIRCRGHPPCNGCLFWLRYSGLQPWCHNILNSSFVPVLSFSQKLIYSCVFRDQGSSHVEGFPNFRWTLQLLSSGLERFGLGFTGSRMALTLYSCRSLEFLSFFHPIMD
jgi:hypothetical protein